MIYLESPSTDPYFNLAMEEYIFSSMDQSKQYFMLWQNDNTIVVGKYQNTAEEINQQFVEEHGIKVARRLSGGGAVYHDRGNLNFTFIVDQRDLSDFNFEVFVVPVIKALQRSGVHAEFNGRNDLTINGKKFSGNSQYTKHGRILHHGCIMLDSNLTNVSDALKVKDAKFESKSVKSVRSRVTTINAAAPEPITMKQFKDILKDAIAEETALEPLMLSEVQLAEVRELRNRKYATWEWNYGRSPAYEMRREKKFSYGLVCVYLSTEHSRIKGLRFYGDFFGNEDLSSLEESLIGVRLGDELKQRLLQINLESYINGITADDLYMLIMNQ